MRHQVLRFAVSICLVTATATAATRERSTDPPPSAGPESFVVQTYARLSDLAAASGGVAPLHAEVTDVRTGPLNEILGARYTDLATLPSRAMILLTPVNNGQRVTSVLAQWQRGQYATLVNPYETVGQVMSREPERYYDVSRYVSYAVTVTLDGRSETYRALALIHDLFGAATNPTPDFWDFVTGMGGSVTDIWRDRYAPAVDRETVQPSRTGRAVAMEESPSSTCFSGGLGIDHTGHGSGGYHYANGCVTVQCVEDGPDYQKCAASVTGVDAQDVKSNPFEFSGYHVAKVDAHGNPNRGPYGSTVTCSAVAGAGFKACPEATCMFSFSVAWQGFGTTVSSGGDVWNPSIGLGQTCNLPKPPAQKCQSPGGGTYGVNDGSGSINDQVCPDSPDGGFNSPILIDLNGDGYALTDAAGGVAFDLDANGRAEHIAWTAAGSDDAFLALDRNGNGVIDNGLELFGNITVQRVSNTPNGFAALKELDGRDNGGNGDGVIDASDAAFSRLLLWRDRNHNGFSEPDELQPLSASGVKSLDLDYKDSRRTDDFGNEFRYRGKVGFSHAAGIARWAWDVFFKTGS